MSTDRIDGYARALFEIARAEGTLDEVEDELFRFARSFEGSDALRNALTDEQIPADRRQSIVESLLGGKATVQQGFKAANDVLQNAVQGISDLITCPGLVNVDFADVRTVMSNRGMAMMGLGTASGEDRAQRAVEMALSSPLLDDLELAGARGILVNISCDDTLTLDEHQFINEKICDIASEEADMKCGTSLVPNLNGELRVTVVATGLNGVAKTVQVTAPAVGAGNPKIAAFIRPEMPVLQPMMQAQPPRQIDERPAYIRNGGGGARQAVSTAQSFLAELDEEIINIPAFLRHQAD